MKFYLARLRLWLHCFRHVHEPMFSHWHNDGPPLTVTVYLIECKFCRRRFYEDKQIIILIRKIEMERELRKQGIVAKSLGSNQ